MGGLLKKIIDPGGTIIEKTTGSDKFNIFPTTETPEPTVMPTIKEPTVMPLADDEAARRKKKQSLLAQRVRGGRPSTILTTNEKLG